MVTPYDAIVVGARCAGAPTAMLLARKGYRVLLVDRATFPSDTISTHVVHPRGVAALARWGILDRLVASGCPPIHTYAFDFGPFAIAGSPGSSGAPVAYCPRRTILDALLVAAAADAGAEIQEGFTVDELVLDGGRVSGIRGRSRAGASVVERARIVIGADGRHSRVASAVGAEEYHVRPPIQGGYYTYWSNLPVDGRFEIYVRPRLGFAAVPTHDGLTLVVAGWPHADFEANKRDFERSYLAALESEPSFAERLRGARREARLAGASVPNFFRKPYGPGWALVGDAGYDKDPITAQGIADAFRDAELCVSALDDVFSRGRPFDAAMAAYQRARDDDALPVYELTCQLAALEPPPPPMQELLATIARHPERWPRDGFVRASAGELSPAAFFAPENVRAILSSSGALSAAS
jgi:2-polyprenyl-6-methoxyphenol hydroxylase-like FAD-dependent oxidoreductase